MKDTELNKRGCELNLDTKPADATANNTNWMSAEDKKKVFLHAGCKIQLKIKATHL